MLLSYIEVACFNIESALIAAKAGASRIELCADPRVGGTTPIIEAEALVKLKRELGIPIYIMIRPRGGAFQYTRNEVEMMRRDIRRLQEAADGFVFGVLNEDNEIEVSSNRLLVSEANGKPCTMHRAFDQTPNLLDALDKVMECGFSTVLSSGGARTAEDGAATLGDLVHKADGRISIMPGGGIRRHNVKLVKQATSAKWYHSAATNNSDVADVEEIIALRREIEGTP